MARGKVPNILASNTTLFIYYYASLQFMSFCHFADAVLGIKTNKKTANATVVTYFKTKLSLHYIM